MTGYGEGHADRQGLAVSIEMRAVNSRYLKLNCRLPDGYAALESHVDAAVRSQVRRGTVQVNVSLRRASTPDDFRINLKLVEGYAKQLQSLQQELNISEPIRLETLVQLPGAVDEPVVDSRLAERDWPVIEAALLDALAGLTKMRTSEGQAMADDLHANCQEILEHAEQISDRAPQVVSSYQQRLREKLNKLLEEYDVQVQASEIVREVGIFADRADISEEIVRLRSHLQQFDATMRQEESSGRQLEFLVQELLRETNTIGSKANDGEIARRVVRIKTCIERMREMVQNIE